MNFSQARTHMVDSQIHTAGITVQSILDSFTITPRERFVPDALKEVAYCDETLSLGEGRYLLEPMTHARMIQAASPQVEDVVLDIGCATGYSSVILSTLVTTVVALESNGKFLKKATTLWNDLGVCNVAGLEGGLQDGAPAHAPYNLIVINGAVERVPENILSQLAPQGRLVAIVRNAGEPVGKMTLIRKSHESCFSAVRLFDAGGPYLPGFERERSFHF